MSRLMDVWRQQSLNTRTALVTTVLVAGLTAALTWSSIHREEQSYRDEMEQRTAAILETLAVSSRTFMFRLDAEGLADVAARLAASGSVIEVRFFDQRGRLVASSAGVATSVEVDPIGARLSGQRRPLRLWQAEQLTAGQVIEIAGELFGSVSVRISTRPMLLKAQTTRRQGIAVAVVACVVGIATAQILSRSITLPLAELSRTARRIGRGDLGIRIPARRGSDEIAVLGNSLEEMRRDLESLYSSLEGEVADRTRELETANLALRHTNQQLEAKAAELEQFAYTISHDLKSPLITIRSYLSYIQESAETGDMVRLRADLGRISEAATHMRRLLEELLELSRIGRIVNPPEPVALSELAHEAFVHVAGPDSGGVEVRIAPDLPRAYGDRVRLVEVFENLIENAIKYRGESAPKIEITGHRRNGETYICVADSGIGIDPAHLGKVFGLFTQLDPRTEGSGVGLAIAKRIIEVHGGRIWVESDGPGSGSRFCFSLPPPPSGTTVQA